MTAQGISRQNMTHQNTGRSASSAAGFMVQKQPTVLQRLAHMDVLVTMVINIIHVHVDTVIRFLKKNI